MANLFPSGALSAVLALAGLLAGVALVQLAARRAVRQPLDVAVQDEVDLLVGVLSELRRLPYLASLEAADFAAGAHQRIWAALLTAASPELSQLSEVPDDEQCAALGALLEGRTHQVHTDLGALLAASVTARVDLARLAYLSARSSSGPMSDERVVEAGEAVLITGTARRKLAGAGRVGASADPDSLDPAEPPLKRLFTPPSRVRTVVTSAIAALTAALLPGFALSAGLHGASLVLGIAALAALAAGSIVIALVDLETLYVDLTALGLTCAAAWALTGAAALANGHPGRLLHGVVVVAATSATFELANRVYRRVRGVDGQGFGDTLIIVATAGVPAALFGSWVLGYWSIIASLLTALVGWVAGRARGTLTRQSPFAFGPYLTAGWVVGWVAYLVTGWPAL